FELGLDKGVITGGFKSERKDLTKAYDIPGYWNAFSSTVPSDEPGPYGFGAAIGHSSDATYTTVTPPSSSMPPINRDVTKDIGGFIQGIFDNDPFRFNVGVRLDHNSLYGRSINPRASVILKPTEQSALKLLYGEAFQEPAPILLWGGWNGRNANPDLKPEKARNLEFVGMARTGRLFNDVSLFYSHLGDRIPGEVYGPESHA
ncbi:MAG: TonB-dependent receptor, partial [Candidatus Latescibacteria bacterium]|nr:TonB-dependent receptor [Candidatus Latescibacterota bacterium]